MKIIAVIIALLVSALLSLGVQEDPDSKQQQAAEQAEGVAEKIAEVRRGVRGGKHDFSQATGRAGDACGACHVPHIQAIQTEADSTGQTALKMYRMGGQREVFVPDRYMPGPTSLICLGCHDGTVASSTIGTSHALAAGQREGFRLPDGFVWDDHPIGVPYPANPKKYRPRGFVEKLGVRLPQGRLECVSCHDPHNEAGLDDMLVMSNRRSALCLTCHIK